MRRLTTTQGCLIACMECPDREQCEKYCYKINSAVEKLKRYENLDLIPNKIKVLKQRDTSQKPKNVRHHKDFHGNVYKITGECPVCGGGVNSLMRFCDNCGKRLSWISQEKIDEISVYMDDKKREQVHQELAQCAPEEFLRRYLELDQEFEEVLKIKFAIEII